MIRRKLSQDDLAKVKKAVEKSEEKTSGEIVTAFIKESYNYAFYELIWSVLFGFVYFFIMMFCAADIENFLRDMFWDYSNSYLLIFYGFSTFLVIFLIYFLANLPFIDRILIPKSVMKKKVNERAVRYFMESGIYQTRRHTGILIFISFLEKRVELIADQGINEKILPDRWQKIIKDIIAGMETDKLVDCLCQAIEECGLILAEHFPIKTDDKNEIRKDLEILGK